MSHAFSVRLALLCLVSVHSSEPASEPSCREDNICTPDSRDSSTSPPIDEHLRDLHVLLQRQRGPRSSKEYKACNVNDTMFCPGSPHYPMCKGNECCAGFGSLGSHVCPSARDGWNECTHSKRYDCLRATNELGTTPPEPVTYYPHFDTTPDYLDIASRARGVKSGPSGSLSDNFYLVIGDWGAPPADAAEFHQDQSTPEEDANMRDMQRQVAAKMKEYVDERKRHNPRSTLLFVLSVGDNFYWEGVRETLFEKTWHGVFAQELLDVPWFSVLGNHDYGNADPGMGCPSVTPRFVCNASNAHDPACGGAKPYSKKPQGYDSNQLNADKGGLGGAMRANYHMPDYTYYYSIPELDFEIIALDWNWLNCFPGCIGGNGIDADGGAYLLAKHCGSDVALSAAMKGIQMASTKILKERALAAENSNVAIIAHYPAVFQAAVSFRKKFLSDVPSAKGDKMSVFNFYGHTHIQQCDAYNEDNSSCVEFLTGGSGGCCGYSDVPAGFVAVTWNDATTKQEVECFLASNCTIPKYHHRKMPSEETTDEHTRYWAHGYPIQ